MNLDALNPQGPISITRAFARVRRNLFGQERESRTTDLSDLFAPLKSVVADGKLRALVARAKFPVRTRDLTATIARAKPVDGHRELSGAIATLKSVVPDIQILTFKARKTKSRLRAQNSQGPKNRTRNLSRAIRVVKFPVRTREVALAIARLKSEIGSLLLNRFNAPYCARKISCRRYLDFPVLRAFEGALNLLCEKSAVTRIDFHEAAQKLLWRFSAPVDLVG